MKTLVKKTVDDLNGISKISPTVNVKVKADKSALKGISKDVGSSMESQLKKSFKSATKSLKADMLAVAASTTVALAGAASLLTKGVKTNLDVSKSIQTVKALSDESERTTESIRGLEKALADTAKKTPQTMGDMGKAAVNLRRAGFTIKEMSEGLIANTGILATATGVSIDKASGVVANAAKLFKLDSTDRQTQGLDRLVIAANSANQSILDVKGAMTALKGANIDDSGFSILSKALADIGITGSAQGTAIKQYLAGFEKNADKLKDLYGIQVYNADQSRKTTTQLAEEMRARGQLMTDAEQAELLPIFGERGIAGFRAMLAMSDSEYQAYKARVMTANGEMAESQKIMMSGLTGAVEKFTSTKDVLFNSLGKGMQDFMQVATTLGAEFMNLFIDSELTTSIQNAFAPLLDMFGYFEDVEGTTDRIFRVNDATMERMRSIVQMVVNFITNIPTYVQNVTTSFQQIFDFFGFIKTGIMEVKTLLGGIFTTIATFITENIGGITTVITAIVTTLAAKAAIMAAPIIAMKLAITGVVLLVGNLIQRLASGQSQFIGLQASTERIKGVIFSIFQKVKELWTNTAQLRSSITSIASGALTQVANFIKQIWNATSSLRKEFVAIGGSVLKSVASTFKTVLDNAKKLWVQTKGLRQALTTIAGFVLVKIKQFFVEYVRFLASIAGHILKTIRNSKALQIVFRRIKSFAGLIFKLVMGIAGWIKTSDGEAKKVNNQFKIFRALSAVIKGIITAIAVVIDAIFVVVDLIQKVVVGILKVLVSGWVVQLKIIKQMVGFIKGIFEKIMNFITGIVGEMKKFVTENENVKSAVDNITGAFNTAKDALGNLITNTKNWVMELDLVKNAINGIKGLMNRGGSSGGRTADGGFVGLKDAQKRIADGQGTKADNKLIKDAIITAAKEQGINDEKQLAYIVATALHESGNFAFMNEIGSDEYFESGYGAHTAKGQELGNTAAGDGAKYKGRGFVQLTGKTNYEKYSEILGLDLVNNPELAADPDVAVRILAHGMKTGAWTGMKLGDYGTGSNFDSVGARAIVNGSDRAYDIAQIAENSGMEAVRNFTEILKTGGSGGVSGGSTGIGNIQTVDTGNVTGDASTNGGSSAHHIDVKFNRAFLSLEERVKAFDAIARQYEAMGKDVEFSNSAVAGELWDVNASMTEKMDLYQRAVAAHTHSVKQGWDSLDYYAPDKGDNRFAKSAEFVPIIAAGFDGGQVEQHVQDSGYGAFSAIIDKSGNHVSSIGHGDKTQAATGVINVNADSVEIPNPKAVQGPIDPRQKAGPTDTRTSTGTTEVKIDATGSAFDVKDPDAGKSERQLNIEKFKEWKTGLKNRLDEEVKTQKETLEAEKKQLDKTLRLEQAKAEPDSEVIVAAEQRIAEIENTLKFAQQIADAQYQEAEAREELRLGISGDEDQSRERMENASKRLAELEADALDESMITAAEYSKKAQEAMDEKAQAEFSAWQETQNQILEAKKQEISSNADKEIAEANDALIAEQSKSEDERSATAIKLLELEKDRLVVKKEVDLALADEEAKLAELQKLKELNVKTEKGYSVDVAIANQERLIAEKKINVAVEARQQLALKEADIYNDLISRANQLQGSVLGSIGTQIQLPESELTGLESAIQKTKNELATELEKIDKMNADIQLGLDSLAGRDDEESVERRKTLQVELEQNELLMSKAATLAQNKIFYAQETQEIKKQNQALQQQKAIQDLKNQKTNLEISRLESFGLTDQADALRLMQQKNEIEHNHKTAMLALEERLLQLKGEMVSINTLEAEQLAAVREELQTITDKEGERYLTLQAREAEIMASAERQRTANQEQTEVTNQQIGLQDELTQAQIQSTEQQASTKAQMTRMMVKTAINDMSQGIHDMIMNSKSLGEVFSGMLKNIASQLIKMAAQKLMMKALGGFMSGGQGANKGGIIQGFNKGGMIGLSGGGYVPYIPGTTKANKDTVPAMLTQGEGVLTRGEIKKMGGAQGFAEFRRSLRRGFNAGGFVTRSPGTSTLSSTMVGRQTVNYKFETQRIGNMDVVDSKQIQALESRLNGRIESSNDAIREGITDGFTSSNSFRDGLGIPDA